MNRVCGPIALAACLFCAWACGSGAKSAAASPILEGYEFPKPDPRPVQRPQDLVAQIAIVTYRHEGLTKQNPTFPGDVCFAAPGKDGSGVVADMIERVPNCEAKLVCLGPKARFKPDGTCAFEIEFKNWHMVDGNETTKSSYNLSVTPHRTSLHYTNFTNTLGVDGFRCSYTIVSNRLPSTPDLLFAQRLGLSSLVSGHAENQKSVGTFLYLELDPVETSTQKTEDGQAKMVADVDFERPKRAAPLP